MRAEDRIYTFLCALFVVIIVIGNLIYQKFVTLPLFSLHALEVSVGVLLYPLTYLLTDLISEFYGKERAGFCVRLGILMNIIAVSIIFAMDHLEATDWSLIDSHTFHKVFGMYGIAFAGSTVACYISQTIDIRLYLWIKKLTNGRHLWLRNNISTATSLLVDTFIVINFMCFFGAIPWERMIAIVSNSYTFKLFFTIAATPIFYLCVAIIRRLLKAPG